jgi:hypothetical protein
LIEDSQLKKYGHTAQGFVETYGWSDVVDECEGVLEEVAWGR